MMNKNICFITLITLLSFSIAHAEDKPEEVILSTINQCIEVLQDPNLAGADQTTLRQEKLWDILGPRFNKEEIARRALGIHWRKRTAEEKKEFTELFSNTLKRVYLKKTDSYRGQKIHYVRKIYKGNRCKVQTNLFTTTGNKIVIDFSLINRNAIWKVYDVSIEGVSIISNYRSQFNSVITRSSFEDLIEQLQNKQEKTTEGDS